MKNVLAVVKFLFSIGLASFDYFYLVLCIYLFIVKKKKKKSAGEKQKLRSVRQFLII